MNGHFSARYHSLAMHLHDLISVGKVLTLFVNILKLNLSFKIQSFIFSSIEKTYNCLAEVWQNSTWSNGQQLEKFNKIQNMEYFVLLAHCKTVLTLW